MRKRQIEFVIKTSKYCNLRCTYCYEFNELSDRRRLAPGDFSSMLTNLRSYAAENFERICFIWHGGEPLLIKPAFYDELGSLQREILGNGEDIAYWNFTQSNLTALSEETLAFMEEKRFFKGVGVSIDPFGTERVDIQGRSRNDLVLRNMQRLMDRNYEFACITVLTPKSLPYIANTFHFFDTLGIRFRVLPYDFKASEDQAQSHSLTADEHVAALTAIFDLWLGSPHQLRIDPVFEFLLFAIRYRNKVDKQYWDLWRDESVYTVELDGSVWGRPHGYEEGAEYGNLVYQDLATILDSDKRHANAAEASARMQTYCGPCPYFGHCPGKYVGNSTNVERDLFAQSGCWVRQVIDHIVMRLDELGIETAKDADMPAGAAEEALSIAIANA